MKILIIKTGAVGDVLRTTSILPGLRQKYPSVSIDWLTSTMAKELLINNLLINRIYVWEKREELGAYDLIIALEDDLASRQFASSLNSKWIIGAYDKTYTPAAWFDMSAISRFGIEQANELKKKNRKTFQRHMAELLGIKVGPYIFKLTDEEVEYGQKYVRKLGVGVGDRILGINTGAGQRWQMKSLSVEKTIELVNRLKKALGLTSIILGGGEEQERNEIICKETGMPNGGIHSLRHFAAVINQCHGLVTSDSLAMHFGIALAKKIVAFFGPTSPSEIELYGLGTKMYPKIDCLVCYKKKCDKKPNCLDLLSVDNIFRAVRILF
ncbi:hypothetical protein A3H38_03140 [candidate division WOR-1 bacterium RIFCSPLOWO2_02_FULL_46_20]|uniref:Lipopolysaccharide heptosyltransferase II n=2 Tax=Saganbacteria TaxID=1703751 RepID=A0A1F4RC23_UNCSA|nr:MAG: hypothetical protein A3J44_02075 [candidate division WOR-1 bacterium RIFCSPHIGHO2_02_FULL_45_12]OGC05710.1 MAG: hypothetical protein A3H38_03140 [candidate division WOR-1 bacterium RIFCSPLOWO2_02_FULL_46_20]OGC08751.1 MAG: hypothetical protein A3F86_05235 [candidate division WOR-1 bacterium RIFCSPLOWO2_12_FULL_45_9]